MGILGLDLNDRFGHPVGERALVALSKVALSQLRDCDFLGRIGGEESRLSDRALAHPLIQLPVTSHLDAR